MWHDCPAQVVAVLSGCISNTAIFFVLCTLSTVTTFLFGGFPALLSRCALLMPRFLCVPKSHDAGGWGSPQNGDSVPVA